MNPSAVKNKDHTASTDLAFVGANGLALMLAGLAMLGPFSVDTYLPAFPNIQATLSATPIEVQQTLTAYMFAFAFMMLWHGALSDAFGRRNIILGALAVFAVASLGCAAVHSVEYLWAFRILQGVSAGAGVVIGRAIIRDVYSGARATRLLSLVTMIFSIAPAIAPILGGWIVKLRDWRSIFLFLFAYTVLLFWYCYRKLPETLPPSKRQPFNAHALARSYKQVFSSPLFHLKAGAVAFNFAGLFLYVAAAPVFLTQHLGLGPDQFGWQFVPTVAGIFLGALAANRFAGKISITRHVGIGFCFLIGSSLANVIYHAFLPPALPWSVLPLLFYGFGFSVVAPVVTLLVMDLFPKIRGLVSSCQSFTQTMLGAVVAGVAAPFLSHDVLWLAAGQLACVCIALALWLIGLSYHRARHSGDEVNAWETVPVE
jgi:DHA1 family bicyclomycin/chloramphenicol resistance-like MFS transporter